MSIFWTLTYAANWAELRYQQFFPYSDSLVRIKRLTANSIEWSANCAGPIPTPTHDRDTALFTQSEIVIMLEKGMKMLSEVFYKPLCLILVIFCSIIVIQKSGWAGASAQEVKQWLDAHNEYRALHQVGPVTWSDTVAASAQAHADACPNGHSNSKYGENMAWGYSSIESVVTAWYQEERYYDYSNPGWSTQTGHFTQVVWKATTEIGCALKTQCPGWPTTWVCQYNPPGNYYGRYSENVFPPQKKSAPSPPGGLKVVSHDSRNGLPPH